MLLTISELGASGDGTTTTYVTGGLLNRKHMNLKYYQVPSVILALFFLVMH